MRHPAPKLSYFTIEELHANLVRQCNAAGLPDCFREMIDLSFSEQWDWEYNGVTLMPDEQYPVLYAWLHDFMWITGSGGKESDWILRFVRDKQGYKKEVSMKYFKGIRVAWKTYYKWKHKFNGNVRNLTQVELRCFKYAKNYYL